ncbi:MAG: sigma-70 family RNA polymerase sigma factor, partial [Thioalkalivibrio sp.]|nr:sigma-70 family RNA polymerase sigma factor [Thioalkalivibrio sp.]
FDPDRGNVWSWLAVRARTRALDAARSARSYGSAINALEARPAEHPLGTRTRSPEAETLGAERRRQVKRAMASLPPEQRETIEAAFFEGWSHREIAERSGTPLGTVKGRIRGALATLQALLGSEHDELAGGG